MMLHKKEAMPNFFVKTDGAGGGESSVSVFRRIDRRDLVIKRSLDGICICVHKHNFYMIFAWLAHLVPILYGIVFIWAYKENFSLYVAMRGWTDPWWDDFVLMYVPAMREIVAEMESRHFGELSFVVRHLYGISLMMVPFYITLYYVMFYAFWQIRIGQKRLVRFRMLLWFKRIQKKCNFNLDAGQRRIYSLVISTLAFLMPSTFLYYNSFISRHDVRIGVSYMEIQNNVWLVMIVIALNLGLAWFLMLCSNALLTHGKAIYRHYRAELG